MQQKLQSVGCSGFGFWDAKVWPWRIRALHDLRKVSRSVKIPDPLVAVLIMMRGVVLLGAMYALLTPRSLELVSKLLKGECIEDNIGEFFRGQ